MIQDERNNYIKETLSKLLPTIFCIHRNHEIRPASITTYKTKKWRKRMVRRKISKLIIRKRRRHIWYWRNKILCNWWCLQRGQVLSFVQWIWLVRRRAAICWNQKVCRGPDKIKNIRHSSFSYFSIQIWTDWNVHPRNRSKHSRHFNRIMAWHYWRICRLQSLVLLSLAHK